MNVDAFVAYEEVVTVAKGSPDLVSAAPRRERG